jgi:hypothetical protein
VADREDLRAECRGHSQGLFWYSSDVAVFPRPRISVSEFEFEMHNHGHRLVPLIMHYRRCAKILNEESS